MALELHFSTKNQFEKMEIVSANSRLFSTKKLRFPTILRESSTIICALSEYDFLIQGSQHPFILYTDHKTNSLFVHTKELTKPQSI